MIDLGDDFIILDCFVELFIWSGFGDDVIFVDGFFFNLIFWGG